MKVGIEMQAYTHSLYSVIILTTSLVERSSNDLIASKMIWKESSSRRVTHPVQMTLDVAWRMSWIPKRSKSATIHPWNEGDGGKRERENEGMEEMRNEDRPR
jgi:hypothetical protein